MADDEWEKLPALEKCTHKSWKARVSGYEETMKEFKIIKSDPKDPKWDQYLGLIKKFITDSNANGQEKGCEAALMYLEYADCAKKVVRDAVSGVVAKALNGKPKTKDMCGKIVLMCVEIEKVTEAREEILAGFVSKQPKVVAASVNIVTQCLNQFGSKVFPLKPLIQKSLLKPIMEHKDGKVRDEGKALITEMYRWIGDTLSKLLPTLELKELLLKELEEEWGKVERGTPERYTRTEQARMEEQGDEEEEEDEADGEETGGGAAAEAEEQEDIDPYDFADPVDVIKSLQKNCPDFGTMLTDKSWKIRKEALEALLPLAEGSIKIQPSPDFGSIVTPLSKIIAKDSNIVVVQLAVKCLAGISKGLRKGYSGFAKETIIACLSKYKEKKAVVIALLSDCLDSSVDTIQFSVVSEHVIESLSDKNPAVRQETCNFCVRLFQRSKAANLPKPVMKTLCPALKKLLDDTGGPVRDAAAAALGTASKVVGEKFMGEYIADLDPLKKQKVTDVLEKAEVKYPHGAAGPAKKAPAKKEALAKKEAPKKEDAKKPAAKKPSAKKPAAKKGGKAAAAPKKESKQNKQKQKDSEEITEAEMGEDQVDAIVEGLLEPDVIAGLGSATWKVRLEAVQSVSAKVDLLDKTANVQALVQLLSRKPGWKDNNTQVLNEKFGIVAKLAVRGDSFTKRSADYALSGLVEKIGDVKLNKQSCATLFAIADAISLNFTSANACAYAEKQKNPKIHTEMCKWLADAISQFGMKINIKSHLAYVKTCVGSPNAQIRGAALDLIGTMSMYAGAAISNAFSDIDNKGTVSQIEATIEKFKSTTPSAPTRGISAEEETEIEEGGEAAEADDGDAGGMDLEDLIERKDISADLDKSVAMMGSAAWKERNEALDSAEKAMKDANNIKDNIGSDFPVAIKARLADKNMAVKTRVIQVMGTLGKVLGPGTKKHKELMVLLFPLLGDGKKTIQAQVTEVLNTWVEHITIRPLLTGEDLVAPSTDNNPNLKICLFTWLLEQIKTTKVPPKLPKELNLVVPGLYKSLEDRNPEVRKAAQACLPYVMAHVGWAGMVEKLGALDTKSKKTVQEILDKNKEEADALAPKKPPPKPKAEPKKSAPKPAVESLRSSAVVEDTDSGNDSTTNTTTTKKTAKKGAGKKPAAASSPAKKKKGEVEEDTDAPLRPNDKKQQRLKDEAGLKLLKWNFKVPRQDYFDQLQELMTPICSPALFTKLFHADFKQHVEALKILINIIPTHLPEIQQSLDLLLKWISLRFFDTNTSVLLASLEWLSKCFTALREDDYVLIEQEAAAFMPYLVIKLGDSKEPVRKSVHALFNELCYIYPASRTFHHLSEGLKVKNSRQRTGVLDQATKLILENGVDVCQPNPKVAFKQIASFIGDKDNSVRMGALNCCVAGWNYIGKDIIKMCGQLSDKDMGMLEERIKRGGKRIETPPKPKQMRSNEHMNAAAAAAASQEGKTKRAADSEPLELDEVAVEVETMGPEREPSPAPAPVPKKRGEFYIDYSKLKPVAMRTYNKQPEISLADLTEFNPPQFNFLKYSPVVMDIEGINIRAIDEINYELVEKIGNLRHPMIQVVIETVSDFNTMLKDREQALLFKNYVNNLIMSAISQLTHFPGGEDERELSVYRAITSIIMQVINNDSLAKEISTEYIKKICKLFLPVLAETECRTNSNIENLVKGVNALMIRLLSNCNTGRAISSLLYHMDNLLNDSGRSKSPKELEILLKCLWKCLTLLEKEFTLTAAERNDILVSVAKFLRRLPSAVWKDGHENDKPYRTVKTLIHKFCSKCELKIMEDLECLSTEDNNQLRTLVESFLTGLKFDLTNVISAGTRPPSASQTTKLDNMFEKMKEKDQIRSTLMELHTFIMDNPAIDINEHMNSLFDQKRKLIERILVDLRSSHNKVRKMKNDLAISAEREGIKCNLELTLARKEELRRQPLATVVKETLECTLTKHKEMYPNESEDIDRILTKIPKREKENAKARPSAQSLPRPTSSPSRSPARSGGSQLPARSMDDLRKRLEMIKQRSKPV